MLVLDQHLFFTSIYGSNEPSGLIQNNLILYPRIHNRITRINGGTSSKRTLHVLYMSPLKLCNPYESESLINLIEFVMF